MRSRCRELALLCAALALAGCEREARSFGAAPGAPDSSAGPAAFAAHYEHNAYAISEGQRLYGWFNCNGCHANGGGAIGPPLMDAEWIYGGEPAQIYDTIVEGRPNGMPAFGRRLNGEQVWQLVAYVRSLSGNVRKDAAPGRQDHMQMRRAEQSLPQLEPAPTAPPRGD